MKDVWNETLRCPTCDKIGQANLSQDNGDTPTIQLTPDGFKAVTTEQERPLAIVAAPTSS